MPITCGFGFEYGGLVGCVGGYGGVILLLGDDVLLDERGVALDVEVRLDGVGLRSCDAGLGGGGLFASLVDGGGGSLNVGAGGADAGGDVDAGDGHVDVGLDGGGLRAGEVGLGLLERHLVVLGVDLGDGCTDVHLLVVIDVDLDDLAGDARADLIEVAVDLSVVGVFGKGGAPVEDARADDEKNDDRDDDEFASGFLRDVFFVRAVGVGRVLSVVFDLHGAADLGGPGVLMFRLLWQVTFLRDNLCNLSARRPAHGPAKAWLRCADRAR